MGSAPFSFVVGWCEHRKEEIQRRKELTSGHGSEEIEEWS